jgi:cytidine deaminase
MMYKDYDALIAQAKQAKKGAYAPYSRFHVGAALLCADGRIYTGANVENAAYSVTCCAERVALFKAVTDGAREFAAIAITSDAEGPTYPCGVCRQALIEFSKNMDVVCTGMGGERDVKKITELLPCAFTADIGAGEE